MVMTSVLLYICYPYTLFAHLDFGFMIVTTHYTKKLKAQRSCALQADVIVTNKCNYAKFTLRTL